MLGPTTVLIVDAADPGVAEDLRPDLPHDARRSRATLTRPIVQYIYETGFTGYRFGYASAISYIFFALIVIISRRPVPADPPQEA